MPGELPLHPEAARMFPARFPNCKMGTRTSNARQEHVCGRLTQCRHPAGAHGAHRSSHPGTGAGWCDGSAASWLWAAGKCSPTPPGTSWRESAAIRGVWGRLSAPLRCHPHGVLTRGLLRAAQRWVTWPRQAPVTSTLVSANYTARGWQPVHCNYCNP